MDEKPCAISDKELRIFASRFNAIELDSGVDLELEFWQDFWMSLYERTIEFDLDNDDGEIEFMIDQRITLRVRERNGVIVRRLWSHRLRVYTKLQAYPNQEKAKEIYNEILARALGVLAS
jgi:hypothetical protein